MNDLNHTAIDDSTLERPAMNVGGKATRLKTLAILIVTVLAASCIALAISYNGKQMAAQANQPKETQQKSYPEVSFVSVQPGDYSAFVSGYGEAKARYELALKSEVSAQVVALSDSFETGQQVPKGTILVELDNRHYQSALTAAKASLAAAKLNLLEEKRQSQQARMEWKNSGLSGEPSSPLVLRTPQLEVAQAEYDQALKSVEVAEQDLAKTQIIAPFNALIVGRETQPGSYLQTGETVATLYNTDRIEVRIPLTQTKWTSIDSRAIAQNKRIPVTLTSNDGLSQWAGYVDRVEQHLEKSTRQRSLVVVVDQPLQEEAPLYPNTYVNARIEGKTLQHLLRLPQTALSQNGEVWYLGRDNTLNKTTPVTIYQDQNYVYIEPFSVQSLSDQPLSEDQTVNIVVRPLSSYLPGNKVTPKYVSATARVAQIRQVSQEG